MTEFPESQPATKPRGLSALSSLLLTGLLMTPGLYLGYLTFQVEVAAAVDYVAKELKSYSAVPAQEELPEDLLVAKPDLASTQLLTIEEEAFFVPAPASVEEEPIVIYDETPGPLENEPKIAEREDGTFDLPIYAMNLGDLPFDPLPQFSQAPRFEIKTSVEQINDLDLCLVNCLDTATPKDHNP